MMVGFYVLWGQTEIQLTEIKADSVTKSSARIGFKTSKSGQYGIIYGINDRYGYQSSLFTAEKGAVIVITGLPADRDIHYRVCYSSPNTSQLICSGDQVTHTAKAPVAGVELAIEPKTFETPPPSLTGEVFAVDDTCSNLREQLANAAKADGNLNHHVTIPAGTACYGNFEFFPKRGPNPNGDGVITVRTAAPDEELPPEGMRISPDWEKSMATIANNTVFTGYGDELSKECSPEEFTWLTSHNGVNKTYVCTAKNTWKALELLGNYSAAPVIPRACVDGQIFLLQKQNSDTRYDMFRCIRADTWIPMTPRGDGGQAMANSYGQAVRGYRFFGLIFEPADPKGLNYGGLLDIGNYNSKHENVTVDRCIFRVSPTGSASGALNLNGSFVAVVNSWFDLRVVPGPHPYNPVGNSTAINISGGKGPFRINNNYVRGSGLLIFVNDNDSVVPRDDIDVRRNTLSYNKDFRCGSPTSDKICRDVRGPIELKRGRRVLFEGNIIEDFWSTLSGGQAFIITPRASGSTGPDSNEYQITDLTIRHNIVRNGTGFVQITGQDDVGYRNTNLTQRVTITNNLITGINGYSLSDQGYGSNRGQILAIANGVEDLTFRHNTAIDNRGSGPSFLHLSWAAIGGFDFRDNILWVNQSEVGSSLGIRWSEPGTLPNGRPSNNATATTILNATAVRIPNSTYEFRNNAIIAGPGVRMADLKANYPNSALNQFLQQRNDNDEIVGFENYPSNLRLNVSSSLKSIASGGADPGVDMDELGRRLGQIRTQWVDGVTVDSATIVFYPPDTYACLAEASDDRSYRNPIRARDESTGDRHLVVIPRLKAGKRYFYRLLCASASAAGEFDTLGEAQ